MVVSAKGLLGAYVTSYLLVSRFLFFPIQMNLSEKVLAHQNPLGHVSDSSGVGGYMKGLDTGPLGTTWRRFRAMQAAKPGLRWDL